jgi:D-alanine transaminase
MTTTQSTPIPTTSPTTANHAPIVYLNGEFLPASAAKISVFDRGFLFGDGVYEVLPAYSGKPFRLAEHLARLQHSLDATRIELDTKQVDFATIFAKLLQHNNAIISNDYSIYLQVTRGAPSERTHAFPQPPVAPTIFACTKRIKPLSYEELSRGKSAITAIDTRWKYCHIKSISLLPTILLFQQAADAHCDETILLRNGYALEGTSSNVFIVNDGVIVTPPLSKESLSGVTRDLILHILRENRLSFKERRIKAAELQRADEVWISSSTRAIFPIVKLDGKIVGSGKPGAIWHKVIKLYLAHKEQLSASNSTSTVNTDATQP